MSKTYKDRRNTTNQFQNHADRAHFKPIKHDCDERDWDAQLTAFLLGDVDDDGVEQE